MIWPGIRVPWKLRLCQPPGCRFAIIHGIVNEQKDQAIAHELGISYNTLRTQLSRLYRKLGVQTRVGVAVAVFSEALKIVGEESQGKESSKSGGEAPNDQHD